MPVSRPAMFCASLIALLPVAAPGDGLACDNGLVTAHAAEPEVKQAICTAADAALAHLGSCDFALTAPITVEAVDALDANCVGLFHCGEARIELLSPDALAAMEERVGLFRHLTPDRYFASILLHEIAHAVYDTVPCPFESCISSSEYFAYTQQISALSPDERAPIEAADDPTVKIARDALNPYILFMAPDRFATLAWAHLRQRDDRCSFWQGLMSGNILLDHERP